RREQAETLRGRDRLDASVRIELSHDVPQMVAHRLGRERELLRDLRRRKPRRDELEYLVLPSRQPLLPVDRKVAAGLTDVVREDEHADDDAPFEERKVLRAYPADMTVAVDEHRLEVCRLAALDGAAELRENGRARG